MIKGLGKWYGSGDPWVWLSAGGVVVSVLMVLTLIGLLLFQGLGYFWPDRVDRVEVWHPVQGKLQFYGIPVDRERARPVDEGTMGDRTLFWLGQAEAQGEAYLWVEDTFIRSISRPVDLVRIQRRDGSEFFGNLSGLRRDGQWVADAGEAEVLLDDATAWDTLVGMGADGREVLMNVARIDSISWPNRMNTAQRLQKCFSNIGGFFTDRQYTGSSENGVLPAIIGTSVLVILMSILVMPVGVLAAVYMREYARQRLWIRLLRVAVHNLAGVPSVVYGIFGLGFFVYHLGDQLDTWFYADRLPSPTFGAPGLLWAALTLALLTLPVVIVATEDGLNRVPLHVRQSSLALGATRTETLWRLVLPVASPACLTGLILAVSRAAGEVTPLMLVGAAKMAPASLFSTEFPFVHLDQEFMHLGFQVYDLGFRSDDLHASRPMVFATALLLLLLVIVLNATAVAIRNRARGRYQLLEH
jgi:phosphate transport system permease protein